MSPSQPRPPFSSEPPGFRRVSFPREESGGQEGGCGRSWGGGEAGVCVRPMFLLPKQPTRAESPKGPVPPLHMPLSPCPRAQVTRRRPRCTKLPPASSGSGCPALRRSRMGGNPLLGGRKAALVESGVLSQLQEPAGTLLVGRLPCFS